MDQHLKAVAKGRVRKGLDTAILASSILLLALIACGDEDSPLTPEERSPVCNPSAPESLLCSIASLYNDQGLAGC
jgi:hypothetical protein